MLRINHFSISRLKFVKGKEINILKYRLLSSSAGVQSEHLQIFTRLPSHVNQNIHNSSEKKKIYIPSDSKIQKKSTIASGNHVNMNSKGTAAKSESVSSGIKVQNSSSITQLPYFFLHNRKVESNNLEDAIRQAKNAGDFKLVLLKIDLARQKRQAISMAIYTTGLWACLESAMKNEGNIASIAGEIYKAIRTGSDHGAHPVPIKTVTMMLQIAGYQHNYQLLREVYEDYLQFYKEYSFSVINDYLVALARCSAMEAFEGLYTDYMQKISAAGSVHKPSEELFTIAIKAYSKFRSCSTVLRLLDDMSNAGYVPSNELGQSIVDAFITSVDERYTGSLKRILDIYLVGPLSYCNSGLSHGQLTRALQCSLAYNRVEGVEAAITLMRKFNIPLTTVEYGALVRVYLATYNLEGAINSLLLAQENGVDLLAHYDSKSETSDAGSSDHAGGESMGSDLQLMFSRVLERSVHQMDDVYFALVDLARRGIQPPRMALNAVISSSGKLSQLDRSFATFQEYNVLFGLGHPPRSAYDSLLRAVASTPSPSTLNMLSVLQDFESAAAKGQCGAPNDVAFSLLLEVLAEKMVLKIRSMGRDSYGRIIEGDIEQPEVNLAEVVAVAEEVLHVLRKKSEVKAWTVQGRPLARALRRLAVSFALNNDWGMVDHIVSLMKMNNAADVAEEGEVKSLGLPDYFEARLNHIRRQQNIVDLKNSDGSTTANDDERLHQNILS